MAKLDISLTKEKFDSLDDSLKGYYVETHDGKGYELEGIGSIQRALAEEKAKKATKPELVTELEELRQYKAEQDRLAAEAEENKKRAAGETEEWKKLYDERHKQALKDAAAEKESLFADVKRERLTNELVKRGVLPDRAAYLVGELAPGIDLAKGESGYELKKKGGIGDATEFESMINAAKEKTPFFFAADSASGSGASGSGNGSSNGNSKTITRKEYDANPHAYAAQLGRRELTITD